jgi:hypothetical protein
MAKRTFESFLLAYCNELAGVRTTSIKRLFAISVESSARVAEPLFIYAALTDKLDNLIKLAYGTKHEKPYLEARALLNATSGVIDFFEHEDCPKRFKSVYDAWLAPADKLAANRRIVAALRPKILATLKTANITRYRLCEDLSLNKGNIYAYLAGDDTKINWKTANNILEYAEGAALKHV